MGGTSIFRVFQNDNATSCQEALVQFTNITADDGKCQLELDFPPAYDMESGGDTQMNIWTVKEDINSTNSWMESPQCENLIGTAVMQASSMKPVTVIINTVECKSLYNYRVKMASAFATGLVTYTQSKTAGFKMRHCPVS